MCLFQRFLLELWTQCVLVSEVPVRAVDAVCACFRVPLRAVDAVCACFRVPLRAVDAVCACFRGSC